MFRFIKFLYYFFESNKKGFKWGRVFGEIGFLWEVGAGGVFFYRLYFDRGYIFF